MTAVIVFPRNRGEVLVCRRDETADVPAWDAISGTVTRDPERAARRALLSGTDLTPAETRPFRSGESVASPDRSGGAVHPFLFECDRRDVALATAATAEWVRPTALLDRETTADLWAAYDRIRPTVETVAGDTDHGSTWASVRALEHLRDEAALAVRESDDDSQAVRRVEATASELLDARPAMTAVANRVHRAMATADGPTAVERTAHEGIERARRVDREAATAAADLLGDRVATLSRSGTVRRTLDRADPAQVLVAESRPGGEGVDVAEALAVSLADTEVTLTTDAALGAELATRDVETLVVGADSVLADGSVLNKVGTRSAALAAAHEGIEVLVVAASDKIAPDTGYDTEERGPAQLYGGEADLAVANPTFDVTPAEAVDGVVTERGVLDANGVAAVADEHRALRE